MYPVSSHPAPPTGTLHASIRVGVPHHATISGGENRPQPHGPSELSRRSTDSGKLWDRSHATKKGRQINIAITKETTLSASAFPSKTGESKTSAHASGVSLQQCIRLFYIYITTTNGPTSQNTTHMSGLSFCISRPDSGDRGPTGPPRSLARRLSFSPVPRSAPRPPRAARPRRSACPRSGGC